MKKILVTGAAGFIGFHFIHKLAGLDFNIIGLDNINSYYDEKLKYARLQESGINQSLLEENKMLQSDKFNNYRFIKSDIIDNSTLLNLFEREQFDIVIHLAAQAGVRYSLENPYTYIQSNIVGFLNILEACRINKVKHLSYASSSSVYGDSNKVPFSEKDRVDFPVSLYAATKKSNELMAYTYSHLYQLPTTGLRFFTVYGPWGRPDMSPVIFAKAIRESKPIKIFNNGNMQRDFTYIDDIVEGLYKVMLNFPDSNSNIPYYNLYNIGNSKPINLMDFIRTIEEVLGKKAIKEFYPMQPGDVYQTYADTSHLQADVNYKPSHSLKEGIQEFTNWYINQDIV